MNIIHPCNDNSNNDDDDWGHCRVTQRGLGRGECAWWGSLDPWVAVMGVSIAAQPLDGTIPLCCKLTHARMHPQHHKRELRWVFIQSLPDGTKILIGGCNLTCQEFRLLAPRMLMEFCRHKSCMDCRPQWHSPSFFCLGDFQWWRSSDQQWSSGCLWEKGMFVMGSYRNADGGARTMGKGGGEKDKMQGGGGGTQNWERGERRGGMAMGSLVLGVIRARGIGDNAKERGGQSPARHAGLWIIRGVCGGNDYAVIWNLFIVENIIPC